MREGLGLMWLLGRLGGDRDGQVGVLPSALSLAAWLRCPSEGGVRTWDAGLTLRFLLAKLAHADTACVDMSVTLSATSEG